MLIELAEPFVQVEKVVEAEGAGLGARWGGELEGCIGGNGSNLRMARPRPCEAAYALLALVALWIGGSPVD
jgi:hypothetical protein